MYVGGILEAIPGVFVIGLTSPLLFDWKMCLVKTASVLFSHCELNAVFGDNSGSFYTLLKILQNYFVGKCAFLTIPYGPLLVRD